MAWVHRLGRDFAKALLSSEFCLRSDKPYVNRFNVQGHQYYGVYRERRLFISQSRRVGPDTPEGLARVFQNRDLVNERVGPFYHNFVGQIGLLVEAWNGPQWLHIISPRVFPDQPIDEFDQVAAEIISDEKFDPLDLDRISEQATEAIGNLKAFEDFDI